MRHRIGPIIALIFSSMALGAILFGCASLPAKERAVTTLASVQSQLEVMQDAERRACNPVSFDADALKPITECVGPLAQTLQLTTARHQEFAASMAKAYSLQRRAAIALQAWHTGQPAPAELTGLEAQVRAALALAGTLAVTPEQKNIVAVGQSTLDAILDIIKSVRS